MLEPWLKDLSGMKVRVLSMALEMEEHKKHLHFLVEERKKVGYDGELVKVMQEFTALKQHFTMMKDTMASD
eukprot:12912110-Prorocentrum_lima.AAC.1